LLARSFAGPWIREMIFPSVNSVDGSIWKSGFRLACLVLGGGLVPAHSFLSHPCGGELKARC